MRDNVFLKSWYLVFLCYVKVQCTFLNILSNLVIFVRNVALVPSWSLIGHKRLEPGLPEATLILMLLYLSCCRDCPCARRRWCMCCYVRLAKFFLTLVMVWIGDDLLWMSTFYLFNLSWLLEVKHFHNRLLERGRELTIRNPSGRQLWFYLFTSTIL